MAQIIKNRRGSLDRLSSATGSLQKGEILIATGSSNLTGVTNGQGLVFAAVESGSVVAANRVLQGATAPIFSASIYGTLLDGVPFYASSSNTLFLLGADGNTTPDLTGNINSFSASVATSFSASNASIASVTGDFSASVATSFSASAFTVSTLSASVASDLNSVSGAFATSTSASNANITSLSASVASVTGDFSSSVATSFSASAASQTALSGAVATTIGNLSSSIATTDSASAAYAASQLSEVSGAFATSTSASNAAISSLSASVASVTGDFSSSVATSFSASAANVASLSASIATTDSNQSDRLNVIETTYATTGSNIFKGNQVITGSMYITNDLIVYGSSSLFNVTASALDIGDNTIVLSTATPAVRFGGISVQDSGSAQGASGSLFWDSLNNNWIYQHPVGGAESAMSAILISGPKNSGSLGDEAHITPGRIMVAVGDDHIGDSIISASATKVTVEGALDVSGEISSSTISGIGNVTLYSQSVDSRVSTIEASIGGGGSLGTRVANLETISSSYLSFTQSYYSDSSSFDTRISSSKAEYTSFSASAASELNSVSGAVATSFSASAASQTNLSASVATTISNVSGAIATSISASEAEYTAFSASAASDLNSVSGAVATSFSASKTEYTSFSASAASDLNSVSGAVATSFSASVASVTALSTSVDSRLDTLETSLGGGGSIGTRVGNLETISASYLAFTQSYYTDSASFATAISASDAEYTSFSASLQSSINTLSGSVSSISGAIVSDINTLSASIYQTDATQSNNITNNSSSFATSLSASKAEYTSFSASAASDLNSVSGAFATSTSASNAEIAALSASVANTTGNFSSSVAGRLTTIETTYATTGSNSFTGSQGILGDVTVSGSLTVQFGQDLITNHISGNQGRIELGNIDNNITIIADNELMLTATGSGVHVHSANFSVSPTGINNNVLVVSASQTTITNELSASNISGVGNIGAFSQSVDSRLVSLVQFQNSASTALSFDGTNLTVLGNFKVNGSTTQVDSTIVNIGDNIISLNGTGGLMGGLVVKDPTSPNTASGSLLWDSNNDYWIAGVENSESKVLVAIGDNVVSSSAQITLSSTTGFSGFDTAISTSFSASNANIASLSASVASVTGDFSSSVATSFSASNASIAALSASVASVTGDFSSSVATSFSASAFNLTELSASIYLTDVTQSTDITNNSSSFATSISASNFRITVLETTIDGGSF
jgi:hypothetical protein